MNDTVSIIIAAYNSGATIARAVQTALAEAETYEIIVVDDASSDDTVIEAQLADDGSGRLKIIALDKNAGPSAARNVALTECGGAWVGILDADDFFLPGRLKGLLAFAKDVDFIADDIWRMNDGEMLGTRRAFLGERLEGPRVVLFRDFVLSNITDRRRQRGELGFIKPIMRRAFLQKHAIRYREEMRLGEDYELYARALALGARLMLVPAQGYVSVVRADSLSGRHSEEDLRCLRDCDNGLSELPGLDEEDRGALRRHFLDIDCRLQWRLLISAVKAREWAAGVDCFRRPYPVPFYLMRQLGKQMVVRAGKRVGL